MVAIRADDTWNAIVEAARRIGVDESRIKRAMQ